MLGQKLSEVRELWRGLRSQPQRFFSQILGKSMKKAGENHECICGEWEGRQGEIGEGVIDSCCWRNGDGDDCDEECEGEVQEAEATGVCTAFMGVSGGVDGSVCDDGTGELSGFDEKEANCSGGGSL